MLTQTLAAYDNQPHLPGWLNPASEATRRSFDVSAFAYKSLSPGPWDYLQVTSMMPEGIMNQSPGMAIMTSDAATRPPTPINVAPPPVVMPAHEAKTKHMVVGILAAAGIVGLGYMLFQKMGA